MSPAKKTSPIRDLHKLALMFQPEHFLTTTYYVWYLPKELRQELERAFAPDPQRSVPFYGLHAALWAWWSPLIRVYHYPWTKKDATDYPWILAEQEIPRDDLALLFRGWIQVTAAQPRTKLSSTEQDALINRCDSLIGASKWIPYTLTSELVRDSAQRRPPGELPTFNVNGVYDALPHLFATHLQRAIPFDWLKGDVPSRLERIPTASNGATLISYEPLLRTDDPLRSGAMSAVIAPSLQTLPLYDNIDALVMHVMMQTKRYPLRPPSRWPNQAATVLLRYQSSDGTAAWTMARLKPISPVFAFWEDNTAVILDEVSAEQLPKADHYIQHLHDYADPDRAIQAWLTYHTIMDKRVIAYHASNADDTPVEEQFPFLPGVRPCDIAHMWPALCERLPAWLTPVPPAAITPVPSIQQKAKPILSKNPDREQKHQEDALIKQQFLEGQRAEMRERIRRHTKDEKLTLVVQAEADDVEGLLEALVDLTGYMGPDDPLMTVQIQPPEMFYRNGLHLPSELRGEGSLPDNAKLNALYRKSVRDAATTIAKQTSIAPSRWSGRIVVLADWRRRTNRLGDPINAYRLGYGWQGWHTQFLTPFKHNPRDASHRYRAAWNDLLVRNLGIMPPLPRLGLPWRADDQPHPESCISANLSVVGLYFIRRNRGRTGRTPGAVEIPILVRMRCGSDQVEARVPPYDEWRPYDLAALDLQRLEKEDRDLAPEWPMLVKQVFEPQEQVILCLYGQNVRGIRDEKNRWRSMNNVSMTLDQLRLLSQHNYTYTPQKLPHVAIVRLRDSEQAETPQAYRETSARYDSEQAYALAAYLGIDSDLLVPDEDGKVRVPYATFATGGLFAAGPEHATLSDRICYSVAGRPDTLRDIGVKPDSKQFSFKGENPEQRGALVRCVEIATPFLGTSFHNPREVQFVAHQLRLVHPFYDDATTFALPIHWGMKLAENVIPVVDRFDVSS